MRKNLIGIGAFLLVFASLATPAFAHHNVGDAVPEIGASTAVTALGLLTGGALILTERLRRK